jgi:hypothetical protein
MSWEVLQWRGFGNENDVFYYCYGTKLFRSVCFVSLFFAFMSIFFRSQKSLFRFKAKQVKLTLCFLAFFFA